MLLCKMCIEKKLPSYTYNNENFGRQFCEECQSETQHLDYEVFKNKLFDVISNNYKLLSNLPYRAGWFYEAHDEDGVVDNFYDLIEPLNLDEELAETLADDWAEKYGNDCLVLYDDSLEEYEGCNKEFEWEDIQESFKHEFRFFNSKLKDFLDHTFEFLIDDPLYTTKIDNSLK